MGRKLRNEDERIMQTPACLFRRQFDFLKAHPEFDFHNMIRTELDKCIQLKDAKYLGKNETETE